METISASTSGFERTHPKAAWGKVRPGFSKAAISWRRAPRNNGKTQTKSWEAKREKGGERAIGFTQCKSGCGSQSKAKAGDETWHEDRCMHAQIII